MKLTKYQKIQLKESIKKCFINDSEVKKIIIFGSFVNSDIPNDLDIAIFQDSNKSYLELALKYRKKIRGITKFIPLDIFPIRKDAKDHFFLNQILSGEVIYER